MQHYCGINENLLKENNAGSFQKWNFVLMKQTKLTQNLFSINICHMSIHDRQLMNTFLLTESLNVSCLGHC